MAYWNCPAWVGEAHGLAEIGVSEPLYLDPKLQSTLLEYIRNGNHIRVACRAAGISPATYSRWVKWAEYKDRLNPEPPPPELIAFIDKIREAEALCEVEIVKNIRSDALESSEIGLKFLARRYPERWGERKEIHNYDKDWRVVALGMLRRGEVTLEALEESLPKELYSEVAKMIEAPQEESTQGELVEGEFKELISTDVGTTTEPRDTG